MDIEEISKILSKQIDKDITSKRYAKASEILKLVGAGLFLASSIAVPNLPKIIAPLLQNNEKDAWKRFNIPYLERTIRRLERQKLVEFVEENVKYPFF